jgi:hypothetical protein
MMTEKVKEELNQEVMSEFHEKLLNHCVSLVNHSRSITQQNFKRWDARQKVYDGERDTDIRDRKAQADNEPAKVFLPLTTSQVNTFIATCMLMLRQRPNFFELNPQGSEDFQLREPSEMLLERDLKENQFSVKLYQFFLDLSRFGIGVFKHQWVRETLRILAPTSVEVAGEQIPGPAQYKEIPSFVGNRIDCISPYKFFPDVRMPMTRFQEGEFCASEDEFTKTRLMKMQKEGEVAGVKHLTAFSGEQLHKRNNAGDHRFVSISKDQPERDVNNFCVTETQVWLTPSDFDMSNKEKLGEEDFPILHLVTYVNDSRLIRVEPMNNYHSGFTYEVAQFNPDQHKRMSKSIADMVGPVQELIDWYANARVEAVKKSLENNLVVDPMHVNIESVKNRSPLILLSRTAGQGGIDRYVKHLPVSDNTQNHFSDIGTLTGIMNQATGVNDPLQGQAQTGRRPATEMRAVIQGGNARVMTYCLLAWEQALSPMGSRMLTNHRQNIDFNTYRGVVGDTADEQVFNTFKASAEALIGKTDLFVFDGILPSEKAFMAQSLQELLTIALQAPDIVAREGWDLTKILKEIFELRGITGTDRFKMTPEEQQQALMRQALLNQQPQQTNGTPASRPRI